MKERKSLYGTKRENGERKPEEGGKEEGQVIKEGANIFHSPVSRLRSPSS